MLASHPEHFGTGVKAGPESDESFQQSVAALDEAAIKTLQETLDRLQARSDSRARILLYRYAMIMGNVDQALTVINQAAEDAANRLSALVEVTADSEDEDAQTASGDQTDEPAARASEWKLTDQELEAIADYEAVYIAARAAMDQLRAGTGGQETPELQQARQRLTLLRDLGIDSVRVSPEAFKNVYLSSGGLEQITGDVEAAIAIWQAGLEVLNSDNLDLR